MIERTRLLWLDLETTGTDPLRSSILEIGIVVTEADPDLTVVFPVASWVISQPPNWRREMSCTVEAMHRESGLLDAVDCKPSADIVTATTQLITLLRPITRDTWLLAGSGVSHFDRPFIRHHMPRLEARLEYGALDIGVHRRLRELAGLAPVEINEKKTHRAHVDIQLHIAEARIYLAELGRTQAVP